MIVNNYVHNAIIIADNIGLQASIKEELQQLNITPLIINKDVKEVLKNLKNQKENCELCIIDFQKTNKETIDAIETLKKHKNLADCHFITIIETDEDKYFDEVIQSGLSGYIIKPLQDQDLYKYINVIFDQYHILGKERDLLTKLLEVRFYEHNRDYYLATKVIYKILSKRAYPDLYFDLGRIYAFQKKGDSAAKAFSSAISLNPKLKEKVALFTKKIPLEKENQSNKIPKEVLFLFENQDISSRDKIFDKNLLQHVIIISDNTYQNKQYSNWLKEIGCTQIHIEPSIKDAASNIKKRKIDLVLITPKFASVATTKEMINLKSNHTFSDGKIVILYPSDLDKRTCVKLYKLGIDWVIFDHDSLEKIRDEIHFALLINAITTQSEDATSYNKAAYRFYVDGHYKACIELAKRAWSNFFFDSISFLLLGMSFQRQNKIPDSTDAYQKCIENNPNLKETILRIQSNIKKKLLEKKYAKI